MKELLKRLLEENKEMQQEIIGIEKGDYKTGYLQALINVESSLKFELSKLTEE
jgi:hypothetical protein